MPFKLEKPVEQTYSLDLPTDIDPEQNTTVTIAQITQREIERLNGLSSEASRIFRDGSKEVEVRQKWNRAEQMRMEVLLTITGSNMTGADDKPLFVFKQIDGRLRPVTEKSFNDAWGSLPVEVTNAVYARVLEHNPILDPKVTSGE